MIPIQNSAVSSASTASSGVASAARRTSAAAAGNTTPGAANASAAAGAAGAEQVSISTAGQMLQMASMQGATPPASDARIAALQSAIQSGQYAVDPRRIASGLLQDSLSLLKASKPASKPASN